jgi:ammonia channel protein AmtB
VCGGAIRDVPVGRFLVFITLWSLLVYYPVARWSWHWSGWSHQYGAMDFAGGTVVHITSGTTVLAFNIFHKLDTKGFSRCWRGFWQIFIRHLMMPFILLGLRKRNADSPHRIIQPGASSSQDSDESELEHPWSSRGGETCIANSLGDPEAASIPSTQQATGRLGLSPEADEPPHNVNNMLLGTALLWFGSFGFNGGSALGGNLRAVSACVSTNVAACAGGITSLLLFWMLNALARASSVEGEDQLEGHSVSAVHFCDGAVIGLVAITPAAGFVSSRLTINRCLSLTSIGAGVEFWNIWDSLSNCGQHHKAVYPKYAQR